MATVGVISSSVLRPPPGPNLVAALAGTAPTAAPTPASVTTLAPGAAPATTAPTAPKAPIPITMDVPGPKTNALAQSLLQNAYGKKHDSPLEVVGGLAQVLAGTKAQREFETAEKAREQLPIKQVQEYFAGGGSADDADQLIASGQPDLVKLGLTLKTASPYEYKEVGDSLVRVPTRGGGPVEPVYTTPREPYSDIGKLEADYAAGRVSPELYAAEANRLLRKSEAEGMTPEMQNFIYGQEHPEFFEKMKEQAAAGAAVTTLNGEKMPPAMVEAAIKLSNAGDDQARQAREMSLMYDVAGQLDTGYFAPLSLEVKSALQSLGIDLGDDVNAEISLGQLFRTQQNQLALWLRNPESGFGLPGSASNFDIKFLLQGIAGLGNTQEANKLILITMGAKMRREAEIAHAKSDFMFTNNSLSGWNGALSKIVDQPFFTPEEQTFIDGLGKRVAPLPEGTTRVEPGAEPGIPEGAKVDAPGVEATSGAPEGVPSVSADGKEGLTYSMPTGDVFVPNDALVGTKIPVPGGGFLVVQ